jgi:hypothetical protein
MENATPTARGRWEAMVDVCGITLSPLLPKTLCLPPEMGSAAAATSPSSTSRTASAMPSRPPAWPARATKKPPDR